MLKKKKYIFTEKLGSGSYGDVISIKKKRDNKQIAAKIVHKDCTSFGELHLWPRLRHNHILPLLDVIKHDEIYIFLMPQHATNLAYALAHPMFRQNEELFELTIDWMRDIINGLSCLHESGMCHLDLKSDNILITYDFKAVISDFSVLTEANEKIDGYVLPKYYRPPEAWSNVVEARPKVDGALFDVWSIGMIIFYCFSNRDIERQLWGRRDWMVDVYPLMYNCLQEPFFSELMAKAHPCAKLNSVNCSQALNILRGILRYNANDRPTAKYILEHSLLSKTPHPGNLLDEDAIWVQNKREEEIKTRQFNPPILQEFAVQQEKTNLKYSTQHDISENVDIENVKLHNRDTMKIIENVAKIFNSKDRVISKSEPNPLESQQKIINLADKKGSEMINNGLKKISRVFPAPITNHDDALNENTVLANHVSDVSIDKVIDVRKVRLQDKMIKNTVETVTKQMNSKDENISKDEFVKFETKCQKIEKLLYLEDGDAFKKETVNRRMQHETKYLRNSKDSAMMSSKTPEDLPELTSMQSSGTDDKKNLEHHTSGKFSHKDDAPNTVCKMNDSENSVNGMPSNVGDVIQNEKLAVEVDHEIITHVNSNNFEKEHKILNKTPEYHSATISNHTNNADKKENLVYGASHEELTEIETKNRKRLKKKKSSLLGWFEKKFSNFSKIFARKSF